MLLGTYPPRLPVRALVSAGQLFGLSEGACRTALSRLVSSGDLVADSGWYELAGPLLDRQYRQDVGREGNQLEWDGSWRLMVVVAGKRTAAERVDSRAVLGEQRYSEMREGVWVRPANLPSDAEVTHLVSEGWQSGTIVFDQQPDVHQLWPLAEWHDRAEGLRTALGELLPPLENGDRSHLARGFVIAAAVLRHFRADPLLPPALLPDGWSGPHLRRDYDRFDEAYRRVLQEFFRDHR